MSRRSLANRLWYNFIHAACRLAAVALFRFRFTGRRHMPTEGGVLVCSNHQSHFDPVLVGIALDRRLNYLARKTLFRFPPFGWLIGSLGSIPIDREGMGLAGLRATLRRLRAGEMVLIFPEGTRCRDGEVAPLKPGFCALVRRARVPLLPVGIDGAYQAWPRGRPLPTLGALHLTIGEPILPEQVAAFDDEQLIGEVYRRIRACHAKSRQWRRGALGLPRCHAEGAHIQ